MNRPTSRVLALLEILQSGGTHTARDLAARLEVDERTVRRYVDHLLDLHVPVWSERGRTGGYRLAPGYRMPPLMLSDDESVAVLLGLLAASRTSLGAATEQATASAAAKVRRVLPRPLARRVDALLASVALTADVSPTPTPDTSILLTVTGAAHDRHPVSVAYTDRHGTLTARRIEPYGVVAHAGRWYLVAADSTDAAVRSFRLDRISGATAMPGTFKRPEGLDLRKRLLQSLATAPYRHEVSVLVEGTADEVRGRLPASVATVETAADGVRVRLRAERLEWVPGLLVGLDLPFQVEGPPELRTLLRDVARRLDAAAVTRCAAPSCPPDAAPRGPRQPPRPRT